MTSSANDIQASSQVPVCLQKMGVAEVFEVAAASKEPFMRVKIAYRPRDRGYTCFEGYLQHSKRREGVDLTIPGFLFVADFVGYPHWHCNPRKCLLKTAMLEDGVEAVQTIRALAAGLRTASK
jgi:hypothetical protein